MIIYIHGFGGSGEGKKVKILRELLSHHGFIAPSLSYVPTLAINTLKELITTFLKTQKVYLIGSSLGGYYTTYLADYFNIPAVLINPAMNPTITLKRSLGYAPNFYDNSSYEWNENHLEMLKRFAVKNIKSELYMLLSQKGDELLDYQEAVDKFSNSKTIVEENGNHSFDGIERHISTIQNFFAESKDSNKILEYINIIGYKKFIQYIEMDKLIVAMYWFNDKIQHNIFDSMSQRLQDRFKEEIELLGTPSIEHITESLLDIKMELENEFYYELEEVINENDKKTTEEKYSVVSSNQIKPLLDISYFSYDPFKEAFEFATIAHKEQKTPFGYPYIFHCVNVAIIVLEASLNEKSKYTNNAVIVALLHDTLEDTDTTYDEIKDKFGEDIANGVMALTLNKTISTKAEQIKDSLERIKKCEKWVWMVKLSDRINNLGTPPSHWDKEKKLKYLNDARAIYLELKDSSKFLATKLKNKIINYEQYC